MLLPSLPWQAAHTCVAMPCAFDFASFCATVDPEYRKTRLAASAKARIMRRYPLTKGGILLEFAPLGTAMHALSQAQFLRAAARPADLPPPGPTEIAFAGRSNVGKSSAINALTGRRGLARTSKTPGRTQTINFYGLGDSARLADLPGYGFARVSKSMRALWAELIGTYLEARPSIAAVVVIMDARHPLTPLDEQLLEWLEGRRVLVLLSKADKLSRAEQAATLRKVRGALDAGTEVRLFSSVTLQGVEECRGLLEQWLEQPAKIKSPR